MEKNRSFVTKPRKKVLFSNDFREVLITQNTTIIEQRIIMMILASIKEEQSAFIELKLPFNNPKEKQLSFDDCFDGWANQGVMEFVIPTDQLNPGRKMKNTVIQSALINMSNINWFRLRDVTINGFKAVPFISEPRWNSKNIFFNMDRAVIKNLLNMSQYFSLKRELPYHASTSNTLKFLLWIIKFKKIGKIVKSYSQVLGELAISNDKYDSRYRFERDFLRTVKADLDSLNDISFNYSFSNGQYHFVIYYTEHSVGKNQTFSSLNDLQISRSLKYLKKTRSLEEGHLRVLKQLYDLRGYIVLSSYLKRKIQLDLKGGEYVKAVLEMLAEK